MEKPKGRGKKGKNLGTPTGNASVESLPVNASAEQGNNSPADAGEAGVHELSIALPTVTGKVWADFQHALDHFAGELAKSDVPKERAPRIVRAIVPADGIPEVHKGLTSGFQVEQGSPFSVQLNNGVWLEA